VSQPRTAYDASESQPVAVINAFTVPPDETERFQERWTDTARILVRIMADQPVFIRARLYRCLTDDAEPRIINISEWDSATPWTPRKPTPNGTPRYSGSSTTRTCTSPRGQPSTRSPSTSIPATHCDRLLTPTGLLSRRCLPLAVRS
jgi:hypothetical protein